MPQASDAQRAKWGIDSSEAINFLQEQGYVLTEEFEWKLPPGRREHGIEPTEEEWSAIAFLIDEWDFGSISEAT